MVQTDGEQTELHQLEKETSELSKDYLAGATHVTIIDFIQALEASTAAKYNLQWCKLDPVVAGRMYKEIRKKALEEPIAIHELLIALKIAEAVE
ncbi:MAG: hypothetical protein QNK31_05835 [Porticoccus sp.]|nr:hypothetical protein [Porticoccus sp.]